jgi:hypothetical protein
MCQHASLQQNLRPVGHNSLATKVLLPILYPNSTNPVPSCPLILSIVSNLLFSLVTPSAIDMFEVFISPWSY